MHACMHKRLLLACAWRVFLCLQQVRTWPAPPGFCTCHVLALLSRVCQGAQHAINGHMYAPALPQLAVVILSWSGSDPTEHIELTHALRVARILRILRVSPLGMRRACCVLIYS